MSTIQAVDLYWRPGCGFCSRLQRQLEREEIPTTAHNIWENPDHAATVRSVARGNETVPTVFVGDVAMVNPSIAQVMEALAAKAPHLLPEGWTPPGPSPVSRLANKFLR